MWLRQESICCSAGDPLSIPGSGRSSGEGNDNPLQDSCLENLMDRGAWLVTVNGVTKSQTHTFTFSHLGMVWGDWMALRGTFSPTVGLLPLRRQRGGWRPGLGHKQTQNQGSQALLIHSLKALPSPLVGESGLPWFNSR